VNWRPWDTRTSRTIRKASKDGCRPGIQSKRLPDLIANDEHSIFSPESSRFVLTGKNDRERKAVFYSFWESNCDVL